MAHAIAERLRLLCELKIEKVKLTNDSDNSPLASVFSSVELVFSVVNVVIVCIPLANKILYKSGRTNRMATVVFEFGLLDGGFTIENYWYQTEQKISAWLWRMRDQCIDSICNKINDETSK